MMVSKLSWKEQIACESRRQPLADGPSPSRSNDQLMHIADTPSTLARALDPLAGRESCLHGLGPVFAIAQHKGEIVQVTYQLLPWISNVISLPLRYYSLSIKYWSRWSKTEKKDRGMKDPDSEDFSTRHNLVYIGIFLWAYLCIYS